ncbi:Fc.00g103860.m01.CDS01 [Cosmosporella sp. VM-42]
MPNSGQRLPPDAFVNQENGRKYWQGISADVKGMLGGFTSISRVDLQGSRAFLARLGIGNRADRHNVARALEGGAGLSYFSTSNPLVWLLIIDPAGRIGRVTQGLLLQIAERVDVVEPVAKFTAALEGKPGVGDILNIGLEEWQPAEGVQYDLIWTQWCVNHLSDAQLVRFLKRCKTVLNPVGGVIVLKENTSTSGEDLFDETDSTVTRIPENFESIFKQAGLRLIRTDQQRGFPGNLADRLFPIMMFTTDSDMEDKDPSASGFSIIDDSSAITLILIEEQPIIVQTYDTSAEDGYRDFAIEIGIDEFASFLPHCGSLNDRSARSDDPAAWKFIHNCITTCNSQHSPCQALKAPTELPKRLLDIGSKTEPLRIHETISGEVGKYAALSHCWGHGYPLLTLSENLEQRKPQIDPEDLANTFKNAVEDDTEDWGKQASQMAGIYQRAYVTIAAGSSPEPSTSIFGERDDRWRSWQVQLGAANEKLQVRRKVSPILEAKARGSYAAADWLPRAAHHSSHSALDYAWGGPLYRRAWCLQEQLLSKRMVRYTPGATTWECLAERQVEGEGPVKLCMDSRIPNSSDDLARQWRNTVVNYSQRKVTFGTDRLIALSGIASETFQQTNDQYLAGLWKSSLFWDLLWHPDPYVESPVPNRYIAPSWSWASLGGPAVWNPHPEVSILAKYAKVESASTSLKSPFNPFGGVASEPVTIRSPVVECFLTMTEGMASVGGARIIGSWEKTGHFTLPDTRLYEADGLLENGETEKTCRRAEPGEYYWRYEDEEGEPVRYQFRVTVLCFLNTKALDVVGLVLGRSTTVAGAHVRVAPVWKLPVEYVKRAETKFITIV